MRIAIRVDASLYIGTGHVSRCLTLAKMVSDKGHYVFFICRDLPDSLITLVQDKGYEVKPLLFTDDQKKKYLCQPISDDYKQWFGVSKGQDSNETIDILKNEKKVDLLVIDSYSIDFAWERKVRKYVGKVMVIDDLANRKHDCDILLDHNCYLDYENRYDKLVSDTCLKLLGPKYALINPELKSVKEIRKLRKHKKNKNILIFLGGNDTKNYTELAVEKILNVPEFKGAIINVVLGKDNKQKSELKSKFAGYDNIVFHIQPEYYFKLLEYADLAVGAGGVSQLERMYVGLPTMLACVAENQRMVVDNLIEQNHACSFNLENTILCETTAKIKDLNIELLDCTKLFDAQIKQLKFRDVKIEDALEIYNWRTSLTAIANSKNNITFSYNSHLNWMKNKLNDPDCLFIIASMERSGNLGVIRFDIDNELALVSIFLNPEYINKGYGKILLDNGVKTLKNRMKNCNFIIAEVLSSNEASKKLFLGQGFKEEKTTYILKVS